MGKTSEQNSLGFSAVLLKEKEIEETTFIEPHHGERAHITASSGYCNNQDLPTTPSFNERPSHYRLDLNNTGR